MKTIKKITLLFALVCLGYTLSYGQNYTTRSGQVKFKSSTSEEMIEATNNDVAARLIAADGKGQFIIPIKSFKFKKALMQEHFNENYMESDKYTKATYNFKVSNWSAVNLNKAGTYNVQTSGDLTIKGVTKNVNIPGKIIVTDANHIRIEANFSVAPSAYGISIPKVVENKIAKSIQVSVNTKLTK